jgi:hypothetical protein
MAGTSNIAPLTATGVSSTASALTTRNGTHKHKPKVSHAGPALASRFGKISELSVALAILATALEVVAAMYPVWLTRHEGKRKKLGDRA